MKVSAEIAHRAGLSRSVRLVTVLLAVMLTLAACVTQRGIETTPPPLLHRDSAKTIADVDVLQVSPAMEAFLERYVLPYENLDTRLDLLALAVVENGALGFSYSDERTMTADETFENRSGNCISHANMFIAMARRAGLDARYQHIVTHPEWFSRDDIFLRNEHINVVINRPNRRHYVDVSGTSVDDHLQRFVISDREGTAMFYNNLGAEALIRRDIGTAYAYVVKAIETAPEIADAWVNLGVVFRHNGQIREAEIAQKTALQLDSNEYSAMSNLYTILREQDRMDEAAELRRKVENYRRKNPYYLMMLGNEALAQSRFDDSISLLKKAVKKKKDDPRLHLALARAQYLAGKKEAAEHSLLRAREVAPKESVEYYNLPLDQLINRS